jgi:hypothetical protein
MVHTYATYNREPIKAVAKPAFLRYLKVNLKMLNDNSCGQRGQPGFSELKHREAEIMTRLQTGNDLERRLSFIGVVAHSAEQSEQLQLSGLDEIVCLIDFGMHHEEDMFSRYLLSTLLRRAPSRHRPRQHLALPVVTS